MIKLDHLRNCPSVVRLDKELNLEGRLSFCTDTRRYHHPSAFVAIPGVKVNPLDLIGPLLEAGCPVVFYVDDEVNSQKVSDLKKRFLKTTFVPLKDSVTFLQELAHEHIKYWKTLSAKNKVFAISGSNGKTTHKEMLSFILKSVFPGKIISTEKNNNNHLGVPLTLLQVHDQTEIVVLELGSNHPGEIKVLCDIAVPDAGLTTNIGATHLEFFGDEEKVFEEEGYLYHSVKSVTDGKGFFLINIDDPYLRRLLPTEGSVTYGEDQSAMAQVKILDNGASISFKGKHIVAQNLHITGRHNKLNLITSLLIATHFYPQHESSLASAAQEFRPTKNRSEWIEFENRSVYLDAYNANPSSMKAALLGFKESILSQGFKLSDACIVLGDMNELGDSAALYHKEVGSYLRDLGFPNVYFIGRYGNYYKEGFSEGNTRSSSEEFKKEFREVCLKKFSIHFIKGSRSLQLESLFDIT